MAHSLRCIFGSILITNALSIFLCIKYFSQNLDWRNSQHYEMPLRNAVPITAKSFHLPFTSTINNSFLPSRNDSTFQNLSTEFALLNDDNDPPSNMSNKFDDMKSLVDIGNQTHFNLLKINNTLNEPWKSNFSYIADFRKKLLLYTKSFLNIFATKESTRVGIKLRYGWERNSRFTVTSRMYKYFPKENPFPGNFSRCSVVGNSGILKYSKCGADIDKSEFVIRCNTPPMKSFEEYAGRKCNLTTMNPSIIKKRFNSLKTKDNISNFVEAMQEYEMRLWLPTFILSGNMPLCYTATKALDTYKNNKVHVIAGHPHHLIEVRNFWKDRKGIKKMITTGFYMINVALQLCNEVHLYGFWPFKIDPDLHEIPYHYFDDMEFGLTTHNISSEFESLLELHKAGAIRIHSKC